MINRLVITDLTRMQRGRVCIAGYDKTHTCFRPVLPHPGILESKLFQGDQPVIFPFALIEMELLTPIPEPPHTEDVIYNPDSVTFVRAVQSREEVLGWSLFPSIGDLFEQPVLSGPGYYVKSCQGPRSLGTIQPAAVTEIIYEKGEEGAWDYRLAFTDQAGLSYKLKITDLTWHYYCDSQRDERSAPQDIAAELGRKLQSSRVYLRIGLARGWHKFPERCYLQLTGIYTFPDYLEEHSFASLSQARRQERGDLPAKQNTP
ncbi:MAG: hypothetical protein AB1894_26905 [Chloroflexota bacterium]